MSDVNDDNIIDALITIDGMEINVSINVPKETSLAGCNEAIFSALDEHIRDKAMVVLKFR